MEKLLFIEIIYDLKITFNFFTSYENIILTKLC